MNRFQRNKLLQLFRRLDLTGDGIIEYADFVAQAEAARKAYGWAEVDPLAVRLVESRRRVWAKFQEAMDYNQDGAIELEEWEAFFGLIHSRLGEAGSLSWLEGVGKALFDCMDLDEDGRIDAEDHRFYLESYRADPDPEAELFRAADSDGKGFLGPRDVLRMVREWLLNHDPGDPVNYFLTGRFLYEPQVEVVRYPPVNPQAAEPTPAPAKASDAPAAASGSAEPGSEVVDEPAEAGSEETAASNTAD